MTDAHQGPWSGRVPEVKSTCTISTEDYASITAALTEVLNGRACCPQHAALIAITAAAGALHAIHGDKLDTIDRELKNACNLVMNNFRNGLFSADSTQKGRTP